MSLLYPLGLLLSLLLPIIVILHFKKRQAVEIKISNIGLWDEVIKEVQGIRYKKINRYLLLLIQLLIGGLIVIAFSRPVRLEPFKGQKLTIALDCSITMQAVENGKSRFDMAKEEIKKYIEEIDDDVLIDLIALKSNSEIVIENGRKRDVKDKIKNIKCTYECLDTEKANKVLSLKPNLSLVFSDKKLPFGDRNIKIGGEFKNIGIISGKYDYYSNTALFSIKNYDKKENSFVVELKDEQGRKDMQKLEVKGDEIANLSWSKVWEDSTVLCMSILEKDMLKEDNCFFLPIGNQYKYRVLMVGENYFLKKVILSIPYIDVEFENDYIVKNDYDLYIINTKLSEDKVPKGDNIWFLNPDDSILDGAIKESGRIEISNDSFSDDLDLVNTYVENIPIVKDLEEMETILKVSGKPVMGFKETEDSKKIYSTIDFNKTNLPLQPDFPILIENLIKWFLSEKRKIYELGDKVYVKEEDLSLITPSGIKEKISSKSVALKEIGVYKLVKEDKVVKNFFVNPSKEVISDYKAEDSKTVYKDDCLYLKNIKRFDFRNIIISILLLLLIVEWEVYRRDVKLR
ncbi:vWA domain-containing protein [Paramaledivibacter caminithermalis]|uniref:Aerotolerance regulator N-terminal n=1 Tax=Paramaledivibacter caminithermalis (strain DSM 15212 / CIP 107654 / DViRD3) TaxID=1121301 RepID=A0A1M6MVU1_PARC5|nr:VWA domain-containing protein [Paramaledivibacter caminithermalis]SHJ87615.1 Aerotolerance regulator N-terminal [Paramaledivibacter caminithermalis DSM 15212]